MSTEGVILLCVGILLVGVAAVQTVLASLLLWAYRRFQPQSELEDAVEALSNQVTKLRTRKAGAASATRRRDAAENPLTADLPPDIRGLFQSQGVEVDDGG